MSDFVQHDDLPYTVMFDFLQRGVQVTNQWVPALKMEWVEGEALDHFIFSNLTRPQTLELLARNFVKMMDDLRIAGIAHGDLQHGNIIVLPTNELRLVDYDGMYVPSMQGMVSNELGHGNYQHPERRAEHFGAYLDNFSAWSIYASIVGVQTDPGLWEQLAAGDDCLLFRRSDFLCSESSPAFASFETHSDPQLRALGQFLQGQLLNSPSSIPHLQIPMPPVPPLPGLSSEVTTRRPGNRVTVALPVWLSENADALTGGQFLAESSKVDQAKISNTLNLAKVTPTSTVRLEPELQNPVPRKAKPSRRHQLSPLKFHALLLFEPPLLDHIYGFCTGVQRR